MPLTDGEDAGRHIRRRGRQTHIRRRDADGISEAAGGMSGGTSDGGDTTATDAHILV